MKAALTDWDIDLPVDPEEEYNALVRSLRRRKGFGLLFLQGSPAEGDRVIGRVKGDLAQKRIEVLSLDKSTDNLYGIIESLPERDQINIIFIKGLENSLYEYELMKVQKGWNSREIYNYSWKGVPPLLSHLNQQRERFRDNFHICFVFIVPLFALKYFIHRAPDFYDWRSGLFTFIPDREMVARECSRIIQGEAFQKYRELTIAQRRKQILDIQELLEHQSITPRERADLQYELGKLLTVEKENEAALASYEKALEIIPKSARYWRGRGIAMKNLERYAEAIASYEKAIEIKPDFHYAWFGRGNMLNRLGRYEEAIASYDRAIESKADDYYSWNGRGNALNWLGRYEEAIASYDRAIEIADDYYSWNGRGNALNWLGRYEEAIGSYDKALEIADDYYSWNRKGNLLLHLGRYGEAIASLDKAIKIKPDDHYAYYNKACCYGLQGNAELAIYNLQQAVNIGGPEYLEKAKTDSNFDKIRSNEQFQALLQGQTD